MTTFLHQLPHLSPPTPPSSFWASWYNWLFVAVCSVGVLLTISRVIPSDASSLATFEAPVKSAEVKVISTPATTPQGKDLLIETTDSPTPARQRPAPLNKEAILVIKAPEKDSLLQPPPREKLYLPRKAGAAKKAVTQPPVLRFQQEKNLVVPLDTGKVSGLFGEYTPDPNPGRFDNVPMKRLRRKLRREFLRDGLITSKTDRADLWLPEGAAYLNEEEMMPDLSLKYKKIARSFGIGTGPNRYIKTTDKGIALGDFRKEGFFGRASGVFKLDMPE